MPYFQALVKDEESAIKRDVALNSATQTCLDTWGSQAKYYNFHLIREEICKF